jgi:hypothetical protein
MPSDLKPPRLFVRDQDFERLPGSKDPVQLSEARADRAAAWTAYDHSEEGSEQERSARARLECREAHLHRFGAAACPTCHTQQERRPGGLSLVPPPEMPREVPPGPSLPA